MLVELKLDCCSWEEDLRVVNVSAHALKRLTIENSFDRSSEFQSLVFDAPNLLYLRYFDVLPVNVSGKHLQSLVEADFGMPCDPPSHGGNASNLMKAISSVKYLTYADSFWRNIHISRGCLCFLT